MLRPIEITQIVRRSRQDNENKPVTEPNSND